MQARRFRVLNREATGVAVRASKQPSYSGVPGSQPLFRTRTALKTSTASIHLAQMSRRNTSLPASVGNDAQRAS